MATFDVAKLLNKIKDDVPGINIVLKALAKWDVSAFTDVPDGAMQATTDANKQLTIKKLISGTWTPITKIMHDVDKVDGYHASTSATAGALVVRDAQGAMPGNITGNAATASSASDLAAGYVTPVNKGGTGSTTSSGARNNLAVAGQADFTAHENMVGGSVAYGHVRLPELAANGTASAAPYGYGLGEVGGATISANTDLNTIVKPGFYSCPQNVTVATLINCPTSTAFSMSVGYGAYGPYQEIREYPTVGKWYVRTKNTSTVFSPWREIPSGISSSLIGASTSYAASEYALAQVYALAKITTASVTFYISKTGNDNNDGLSENAAFLTWNKANEEAVKLRLSQTTAIIFRFGPGAWGALDVSTRNLSCYRILITSVRASSASSTDNSDIPYFSRIYNYGGLVAVTNVMADTISSREPGSMTTISGYVKTAMLLASYGGVINIDSGNYDIYQHPSPQTGIFYSDAGFIRAASSGVVFNFIENCSVTNAIALATFQGHIYFRAGYVAFTGAAQTARNFSCTNHGEISLHDTKSKTFFPGNSTYTLDNGGSYCGETAELEAVRSEINIATPIGKIEFLPFRYNALPAGWYFCNGTRYNTTTAVGAALKALPATLKTDWGITLSGSGATETINVPNWFHTDGRGPTMRAVNGTSRQVGSVELDDFKNHMHDAAVLHTQYPAAWLVGNPAYPAIGGSTSSTGGSETRMLNRGMTIAIYLGV